MTDLAAALEPFKTCPFCQSVWSDRGGFLADTSVLLVGYQANVRLPENGIFIFQHLAPECGTSLALRVIVFSDLYTGPKHPGLAFETPSCEKHCIKVDDLAGCSARCSAAYVRQLMQAILQRQSAT